MGNELKDLKEEVKELKKDKERLLSVVAQALHKVDMQKYQLYAWVEQYSTFEADFISVDKDDFDIKSIDIPDEAIVHLLRIADSQINHPKEAERKKIKFKSKVKKK
jgi:hypothetical protein